MTQRKIQPLLVGAIHTTAEAAGGGITQKLPLGLGVVALVPGEDPSDEDAYTVGHTDLTRGELLAAFPDLIAEGLGVIVTLHWAVPFFEASATAWGATPQAAVRALRHAILQWPDAAGDLVRLDLPGNPVMRTTVIAAAVPALEALAAWQGEHGAHDGDDGVEAIGASSSLRRVCAV